MTGRPRLCRQCGIRPPAMREISCCFECWPGGPVTPPPCRKCGSREDYYTSGLCARCHSHAPGAKSPVWSSPGRLRTTPVVIDACPDCHAWGVTRTNGWLCSGCKAWRERFTSVDECCICAQRCAVDEKGSCRLCRKQRSILARHLGRRPSRIGSAEVSQYGQQLFFAIAGMWHQEHGRGRRRYVKKTVQADLGLLRPVSHRQLLLLDVPRDLRAGLRAGFSPPPDPALEGAFHQFVRDYAGRHGWSAGQIERIQRGVRIMLGIQDTPGAPIRTSDVALLSRIKYSAALVTDVLAAAGMLEEDRQPPVVRWFNAAIADLPEPMRVELGVWLQVMREGNPSPPRLKPRTDNTISSQLRFALPALTTWAKTYESLREIGRDDVLAALPSRGSARSTTLQGLRSIFKALKARKLVFVNPTARIRVPTPNKPIPPPVDLPALREALESADPTRAALAALLAFHAVRINQLCELKLIDVRGGRVHIGDQVILLADPVRQRLTAYLNYRQATWPNSINPHLFIHRRSGLHIRPVTPWWIRKQLKMSGQLIRQDRILDEAHATGGDVRALCDLFGLSIATGARYATAAGRFDAEIPATSGSS
jgi:hypothetical protein